mgnify:CR=1 FL=1
MRYRVVETIEYEIEANSAEEAEEKVVNNPLRDKWVVDVTDRYSYPAKPSPFDLVLND